MKNGRGGFGSEMPGGWGRLLMRGTKNAELYGQLQVEYEKGVKEGTDVWIHKNRCVRSRDFSSRPAARRLQWGISLCFSCALV